MTELIILFALAGLIILWVWGLYPIYREHKNKKVIDEFYKKRETFNEEDMYKMQ